MYALVAWLLRRIRRFGQRLVERRTERDLPRRAAALRAGALGVLPGATLDKLAAQARWVYPRSGSQLVFAGAAQPAVYVVVDGALEGRRAGDPAGTVRQRVGAGGVVGLGNALTGAASALAWFTAGTRLLAVPPHAAAAAVGPLLAAPGGDHAELSELLDRSPALAGLSTEDSLGLTRRAHPVTVAPGRELDLPPGTAAVIAAGTLTLPDGTRRGLGDLVGPAADAGEGRAVARTPVRAWLLPAVGGLPLLLGNGATVGIRPVRDAAWSGVAGVPPTFGVHPPSGYPPLAGPPGPPPDVSERTDKRFERKLWWLLILLLLLALLATAANVLYPGPAWGEMPADRALLTVSRGSVTAVIDGAPAVLRPGDRRYLGERDSVTVAARATGQLTFRGGALTVLCGGSSVDVGPLASAGRRPIAPAAALTLTGGRLLADTRSTSRGYEPLALAARTSGAEVRNDGVARFAVEGGGAVTALGTVTLDGSPVPLSANDLSCGDGTTIPRPMPSATPSPTDSPSPSPTDSPSASPSPSDVTTKPPTKTPSKTPSRSKSPAPPDSPPVIDPGLKISNPRFWAVDPNQPCTRGHVTSTDVYIVVTDPDTPQAKLKVTLSWSIAGYPDASGSSTGVLSGGTFVTTVGPMDFTVTDKYELPMDVTITASDGIKSAKLTATGVISFVNCING